MKGLQLIDNFISEQDESNLIREIDQQPWDTSISRRTQHYGFRYDYTNKDAANSAAPIPDWCNPIIDKMLADNLLKDRPDQVIINEYKPGQGIAAHTDHTKHFADGIVSLSLGSDVVMDFSRGSEKKEVQLSRRSLLVMHGEARYNWKHGIAKRTSDAGKKRTRRISLTFRKMIV